MRTSTLGGSLGALACLVLLGAVGCSDSGGSGTPDGGGMADSGLGAGGIGGSGGGGTGGTGMPKNSCPGPIVASWKVDGVPFVSSTVLYTLIGDVWQLVLVECVDDGVDRTIQLVQLPGPIAMGSTAMLSYKSLHQMPAIPGKGGGVYLSGKATQISADTNFYTDAAHTGTVTVTTLDAVTMKFSGTFSFTAVNDAGSQTVNITDGVLTNIPFRLQ